MESIFPNLPKGLVYDILAFIPKFGITSQLLYNSKLYWKTSKTIKKFINLGVKETMEILENLKTFNFLEERFYSYEAENFYLTLYYLDDTCPSKLDYVLIYF
jgi:hypothetical protein